MKSVTQKIDTFRKAVAAGLVLAKPETIERVKLNDLPKPDVLLVAKTAAILAAKKTSELIPDCHPVPLDFVDVQFDIGTDRIEIRASVEAVWKTGVEMEALSAVSVAALAIYDMLKPIDSGMEIASIKLLSKKGGQSRGAEWVPEHFRAAVVVTSDGVFQGTREDKSGKMIEQRLKEYGIKTDYLVLSDDKSEISKTIEALCRKGVLLIVTTGGTGLGPRDVTVEATREVMDREIPGITEACRSYGLRRTPYAMLSRGLAAQKGNTLIVNLPGSSNGVRESLDAIFPGFLHAYQMMEGLGHS